MAWPKQSIMEAALEVLSRGFPGRPASACESKQLILAAGRWTAPDFCDQRQLAVWRGRGSRLGEHAGTGAPGLWLFSLYLSDTHRGTQGMDERLTWQNEEFHVAFQKAKALLGPQVMAVVFKGTEFRALQSCTRSWGWGISPLGLLGWAIWILISQEKKGSLTISPCTGLFRPLALSAFFSSYVWVTDFFFLCICNA